MLVTHSGRFHADDVFATAMILMIEEHEVVRTRDADLINSADIVLDVGAEYNPAKNRFDHHQNSFTRQRVDGTPFATAGLIWEHFGSQIFNKHGLTDDYEVQYAISWVDAKLISDIDAVDNGLFSQDPRPSVSLIIAMMNAKSSNTDEEKQIAFDKAVDVTTDILNNFIVSAIAEAQVIKGLELAAEQVENGILILEKNVPFKDFLRNKPTIKRVVYPKGDEGYGVFCNGQENHLPEKFRGLRTEQLNAVSALTDTVFCHKSGFMAVCKSIESALTIAKTN